jgi:hypothetical protein
MPDGSRRVVPRPEQREAVVQSVHTRCGHLGEKRTISLLLTGHWWYGLHRDVYRLVKACQLCRRVNATFSARPDSLQPLPVKGLFYRWGVDLVGPVQRSTSGNVYCLIAIEHLSKHIELVPLPDKEAATTAQAFLAHVLSRFGACAEVVTDRGSEWRGSLRCCWGSASSTTGSPQRITPSPTGWQSGVCRPLSGRCVSSARWRSPLSPGTSTCRG